MANDDIDLGSLLNSYDELNKPAPLSTQDKILGYSRSYLAGPTFNFADEMEAAAAAAVKSLPFIGNDRTYSENYNQELPTIRAEQAAFKEATPYIPAGVEIASSLALNPLAEVGALLKGASALKGVNTARLALTSAPAQAALSGAGLAEGTENTLQGAGVGALLGSATSGIASTAGKVLEKTGLNANRFKLSAYGVGQGDLQRQVKKIGSNLETLEDDLPLVKTLNKYEKAGVINAGNDVLDNFKNVVSTQDDVGQKLGALLEIADSKIPSSPNFQTKASEQYIEGLSGTAKEKAISAWANEYDAILSQFGRGGSLKDLQKAKIGLNYKYDENPYKADIVKALRTDLKSEIENRVAIAAKEGAIPKNSANVLTSLNKNWGELADFGEVLSKGVAKKYGGNTIEDIVRGGATTGGVGSMNIASAASGNPIYSAIGALLSSARTPEGLSNIADVAREFKTPLETAGRAIPELFTARAATQALQSPIRALASDSEQKSKPATIEDIGKLISVYDAAKNSPTPTKTKSIGSVIEEMFGVPKAEAEVMPKRSQEEANLMRLFSVPKDEDMTSSRIPREALYKAVIAQESGGKADAVSNVGAQGLMQVMPATAKDIAKELGIKEYNLKDPETNKKFGQYYLDKLLNMFGGDEGLALTAYHSGPGKVRQLLKKSGGSSLEDILSVPFDKGGLGPVGRKYAKQTLARIKTDTALV